MAPYAPADQAGMSKDRLIALDMIRGVAVLGILAINIAGFAGPMIGVTSPNILHGSSQLDEAAYILGLIFFEGKMRCLFSLLFGAGLVLFTSRAEAAGRDGDVLQVRRLFWLLAIGFLHYLLLWWGDILFVYAACGLAALLLRTRSDRLLVILALALFVAWHGWTLIDLLPGVQAEHAAALGRASPVQTQMVATWRSGALGWAAQELRESHLSFLAAVTVKLTERPFWQFTMLDGIFAETLPLMLLGMVLQRRGMFATAAEPRWLCIAGVILVGSGLLPTALFAIWAWRHHFPPMAMHAAIEAGLAIPHLLMGLGYGAFLLAATPHLARTAIGARIVAAGRMAFSNYIGTSLLFCWVFQGWGLGLFGTFGAAQQWIFVAGGWAIMLMWSAPWLRRYRRGPLEWAWRSLVEGRWLANRPH